MESLENLRRRVYIYTMLTDLRYVGTAVGIAGDELTVEEMQQQFAEVTRRSVTSFPIPRFLLKRRS